jgi:hypothetical protein
MQGSPHLVKTGWDDVSLRGFKDEICYIKKVHKRHVITIYSINNELMMNIHKQKEKEN